eukprot:scaffold16194_cov118-Skeletonema_dohrnii-CCMP3373.AAC.1
MEERERGMLMFTGIGREYTLDETNPGEGFCPLPSLSPDRHFQENSRLFSSTSEVKRQLSFFENGDDDDEFSAPYYPPSYSDNTTILLAIVFLRPSPIPDACARERPAENR